MNYQEFTRLKKDISEYLRKLSITKETNQIRDIHDAIIDKFEKLEPLFRFDYEFQISKNTVTLETKQKFNKKETVDKVALGIINKQSKIQLKTDRVIDKCTKVDRMVNKTTPMYKIKMKTGKSLQKKSGQDLYFGQLLLRGLAAHNKDKTDDNKWYASPDIPFCARPRANAMKMTAKKIRNFTNDEIAYYTRLQVNYQKREIYLMVKIVDKNDKDDEPTWEKLNEIDNDDNIDDDIKKEYQDNLNIPYQLYIPKKDRQAGDKKAKDISPGLSPVPGTSGIQQKKNKGKKTDKKDKIQTDDDSSSNNSEFDDAIDTRSRTKTKK